MSSTKRVAPARSLAPTHWALPCRHDRIPRRRPPLPSSGPAGPAMLREGRLLMTEDWDATEYRKVSGLQHWLAERALSGLQLSGAERVLDVGCGDGRITAGIAGALQRGEVISIDPSPR